MPAEEEHLQMLLKRCDVLSSSGRGWQLVPPETKGVEVGGSCSESQR